MKRKTSIWIWLPAFCLALNSVMAAKVAVYKDPQSIAAKGETRSDSIVAALKGQKGITVEFVGALDAQSLKGFDALILPNESGSAATLKDNQMFLRKWVEDGHGILATHDAVGYRGHAALFPEIAVGSGNFYTTQQAYKNQFCLVAEHPVLGSGMTLKQPENTAYYDLITISPGPAGRVLARAVATSGKGLFAGAPAVVVGAAGKGRFAACGLLPGGLAPKATPVEPKEGEKQLVINMVRFVLGEGDLKDMTEELGPNAYLGKAPIPEVPWADKLPGLSVEKVLAGGEIPLYRTKWKESMSEKPYAVNNQEWGTPVIDKKLQDFYSAVETYNPVPAGWVRIPIDNWKSVEIAGSTNNPANDAGTVQGYWKADTDESIWTNSFPVAGKKSWYPGVCWYRARVNLPKTDAGKRYIACFDGANTEAKVYVNGKEIGAFRGPGLPFEFDITPAVKPGADNVIAVRSFEGIYARASVQVRPEVYAERILIDPKLDDGGIEIRAAMVNSSGKAREIDLLAEIAPYKNMAPWITGARKTTSAALGKVTVKPGKSEHTFKVKMDTPQCWTPENPFLYVLNLREGKADLGQERFGYRLFVQDGHFFYLNDKRVYLRGAVAASCIIYRGPRHDFIRNKGKIMQRTLLAYKAMNWNNLNPQTIGAYLPREFFDSCDEIGMLLYDLNPYYHQPYDISRENAMLMARYSDSKADRENLKINPDYLPNIERYILRNYNHPSFVMFAVSTEQRSTIYRKALKAGYDAVKKIDRQNRPVCPCSGDAPSQTAFEFSDISDLHSYPGDINGHPWDHKQLLYDYNRDTWEYIGANVPVVNYEAGGHFHLLWPKEFKPVRELWTNSTPDKAAIIRNIEGKDAGYHMSLNARWLSMYGIRRYAVDDYDRAEKEKRTVPSYRQDYMLRNQIGSSRLAGDLFQGFGINYARMYTTFAMPADAKTGHIFEFSNLKFTWPVDPFEDYPFLVANGFNEMRRYCSAKLVMPDLLAAKDVFAGRPFATTLYAINDTSDDTAPQSIRVIMYDTKDNKRILDRTAEIGVVPAAKRKLAPFTWDIPADMATATVRLELFLVEGGKVVSDTYCDFHVLGKSEFVDQIPVKGKKVALYDSAVENGNPQRSTAPVLDALKIPYTRLGDFAKLADFDVLILGAASADNKVYKADAAINAWLKKGGRMLHCEQGQPGAVAGIPQLNIVRKMGGSVVDMIVPAHPVFQGLQVNDYWNLWNGDLPDAQGYGREGGIYTCLIGPLNETAVGTGLMDVPRANTKAVQMSISDVKVGEGMALISQVEATMRYGKDSVATKYIQNALRYVLSDEAGFSTPLSQFTINPLEFYNFGYLEMKNLAKHERAFQKDWLDLIEGGLRDLGDVRFRPASGKVLRLGEGGAIATFKLPEDMPLMFPEREKEKLIKDVDQGTLNRAVFEALYLLHTATSGKEGQKVGKCTLKYKDGSTIDFPVVLGRNIGLAGKQASIDDGRYIGSGMYVARFVNPSQNKDVAAITFEAEPGCELEIAGVTASLARTKIHD